MLTFDVGTTFSLFPTAYGVEFKEHFVDDTIKKILRLIINILSHFYTQLVFMRLFLGWVNYCKENLKSIDDH